MVPVTLRLKNFMSYGEAPPVLEFNQFHVACLSGANGQGKSALLDAITWALWGRARKAAGHGGIAKDLLRIGQKEMHVEYVFDVEGSRYRVLRTFGKVSYGAATTLELHVRGADDSRFRPLSGSRINETQQTINGIVGLDYNTFINSAFLLQGRSDEFTSRPAGERKEILARILNLGRYDILRTLAQKQEKNATDRIVRAEAEIEQLSASLTQKPRQKAKLKKLRRAKEKKDVEITLVRKQEQELFGRIEVLRAQGKVLEDLKRDIGKIEARIRKDEEEQKQLRDNMSEANSLITRADEIRNNHHTKTTLEKERDDLDRKGELYRGLEQQRDEQWHRLTEAANTIERSIQVAKYQLHSDRKTLENIEQLEQQRPRILGQIKDAREARRREGKMRVLKDQAATLDKKIQQVSLDLANERQWLVGQLDALEERCRKENSVVEDEGVVKSRLARLKAKLSNRLGLEAKLEEVRTRGMQAKQEGGRLQGRLEAQREELKEHKQQVIYLRESKMGLCPTCGSQLTVQHRVKVDRDLRTKIKKLEQAIANDAQDQDRVESRRDSLRSRFRELSHQLEQMKPAAQKQVALQESMRHIEERRQQVSTWNEEAKALRKRLETRDFGAESRRRLTQLKAQRASHPFGAAEYESVLKQSAPLELLEEQLAKINAESQKKETLANLIGQSLRKQQQLQQALDSGREVSAFKAKINLLGRKMDNLGYDGARLHAVKQSLSKLSGASEEMANLNNALQNREVWRAQLDDVDQRLRRGKMELKEKRAQQSVLVGELSELGPLEAELDKEREALSSLERELGTLQVSLGQVDEKLQQLAEAEWRLGKAQASSKTAKGDQVLYKHLATAFGKHGIPSLIIESTIPDVEQQANDLLERLTDGKMRIRIDTLRDKKSGGTIETLDIRINDEMGEFRAYETYSGGEAFRVNFALRVALAQLLAARAGVRVQTLVIDEGFGTQDEQGVQCLVEAINAIRDDFQKILIITHLPEVKDAFPVRIEVVKHPVTGSHFDIIGA